MILLAPHDNTLVENNETFTLQLSNPTGGATTQTAAPVSRVSASSPAPTGSPAPAGPKGGAGQDSCPPGGAGALEATSTDLFFCKDSAELTASDKQSLDVYAKAYLAAQSSESIVVDAYASIESALDYNQKLSERRRQSVVDYLINVARVPKDKVKPPIAHGATKGDLRRNRRATVKPLPPTPKDQPTAAACTEVAKRLKDLEDAFNRAVSGVSPYGKDLQKKREEVKRLLGEQTCAAAEEALHELEQILAWARAYTFGYTDGTLGLFGANQNLIYQHPHGGYFDEKLLENSYEDGFKAGSEAGNKTHGPLYPEENFPKL